MTNKTTQPKGTTKQPKVAPTGAKVKQSTSGNTTVAPNAKSSQKASQSVTKGSPVKVSIPRPTIKSLQEEINLLGITLSESTSDFAKTVVRIQRLEIALDLAEAALDVEINKSWWEITKERFVETLYRVFGRFTSYE